ncbi:hypothetical protein GQ55_9G517800 [Panicum hallii var. hallii]|uniref:Uncharacterized protein n=1 Tax=Panicum hallii var. hallii TaxID=1504633 RepID=A0A2T7CE57_9POAL|nr:hypothetical protein GQ55_9G517800 [Panicum hallii var. hallii]
MAAAAAGPGPASAPAKGQSPKQRSTPRGPPPKWKLPEKKENNFPPPASVVSSRTPGGRGRARAWAQAARESAMGVPVTTGLAPIATARGQLPVVAALCLLLMRLLWMEGKHHRR